MSVSWSFILRERLVRGVLLGFLALLTISPGAAYAASYITEPTYQNFHTTYDDYWRGKTGCYAITGLGSSTLDTELSNRLQAAMNNVYYDRYSYYAGTLANLPKLALCSQGATAALEIRYTQLDPGVLGLTNYKNLIQLSTDGTTGVPAGWTKSFTLRWCSASRTTGCSHIDSTLMHELGHAFGLEHSYAGTNPGPWYTVMNAAQRATDRYLQWGACDMAGLQALYGLPTSATPLSNCMFGGSTSIALSAPGTSLVGSSVVVTATMSIDWNVIWYRGTTQKPAAAINLQGLTGVPLKAQVRLWQRYGGVDTMLGNMTWSSGTIYVGVIPSFPGTAEYWAEIVRNPLANKASTQVTITG